MEQSGTHHLRLIFLRVPLSVIVAAGKSCWQRPLKQGCIASLQFVRRILNPAKRNLQRSRVRLIAHRCSRLGQPYNRCGNGCFGELRPRPALHSSRNQVTSLSAQRQPFTVDSMPRSVGPGHAGKWPWPIPALPRWCLARRLQSDGCECLPC